MLCIPRIGDEHHVWMNGIYESVCLIIVFPLIVSIGAGGVLHSARSEKICNFLGEISYPLYITHYPLIYLFTAWVVNNRVPLGIQGLLMGLLVVISSLVIAYLSLKFYDKPVREWLRKKFLVKKIDS